MRRQNPETPIVLLSTSEPFLRPRGLLGARRADPIGIRYRREPLSAGSLGELPPMLSLQPPKPPDREGNAAEIEGGERHQRLEREIGDRQQSRNNRDQGDGDIFPR